MAGDNKLPDPEATHAVIERLREEAHSLRDWLKEAYDKIVVLERAAEASRPNEQDGSDDPTDRRR
jgi:hypothetical protein